LKSASKIGSSTSFNEACTTRPTPGSSTYPVADALGSIRGQTNSAGDLTGTANYDAYGTPRGAAIPGSFGYTGEQTDTTGLVNLRARIYNPSFGRFQSADSVQPNAPGTQGWSSYGYGAGNPPTLTDPSGHTVLGGYAKQIDEDQKNVRVLAGPSTAVKESVAPTLARYGITLFIRVMVTTLAECLLGVPISPWAGNFSPSAPLAGFLCKPEPQPVTVPVPLPLSTESSDPDPCKQAPQTPGEIRLVYENNSKHGRTTRWEGGRQVSRRPHGGQTEWQAILDASSPYGARHRRGIEPDTGMTVELRLHRVDDSGCPVVRYYHGYVPGG